MQKQSYPFCPHGVYVGGCGVDHMCHACEMGDEPPTVNEQRANMRHLYSRDMRTILRVQSFQDDLPTPPNFYMAQMSGLLYLYRKLAASMKLEAEYLEHIKSWAASDDDDRWLYTRHEARIAEWEAQSGDDQFASLPDHVLDGA